MPRLMDSVTERSHPLLSDTAAAKVSVSASLRTSQRPPPSPGRALSDLLCRSLRRVTANCAPLVYHRCPEHAPLKESPHHASPEEGEMSTSADRVGGPVMPTAQEGAAGPLTARGPGTGSVVQRRDSPAKAAPDLLRPAGVTDQSPGPLTPDVVNLG